MAEVARRRQVCPQQVFAWRREMRMGAPARLDCMPIVPALAPPTPEPIATAACSSAAIELQLASTMLRVVPGTDAEMLTMVLRAFRASAA